MLRLAPHSISVCMGACSRRRARCRRSPRVMELGVRTFKFFLTYLKQGWYTDDYQLIKAMDMLAGNGTGWQSSTARTAGRRSTISRTSISRDQTPRPAISMPRGRLHWKKKRSFGRSAWPRSWVAGSISRTSPAARVLRPIRQAPRRRAARLCRDLFPQYLNLTQDILDKRVGRWPRSARRSGLRKLGGALGCTTHDDTLQVVSSDHAPKAKDARVTS